MCQQHEVDLKVGDTGYLAVKPSQQSAGPALYELVDITNRQANDALNLVVVIDDRFDRAAAKSTQQVFRGVASNVVSYSRLPLWASLCFTSSRSSPSPPHAGFFTAR